MRGPFHGSDRLQLFIRRPSLKGRAREDPHIRLSIIVPAFDEAPRLEAAVPRLLGARAPGRSFGECGGRADGIEVREVAAVERGHPDGAGVHEVIVVDGGASNDAGVHEVIVVDGGSSDGSAELAARLGARVVRSPRGRGIQLDAGARAATGDAFLFLHADSTPPAGFAGAIRAALADPRVTFGAFGLRFAAPGARYRVLERATDLRVALTRTPYGDQGFFCRREDYFRAGGFPPWPLLEDVSFARRMKRLRTDAGARARVAVLPGTMLTSVRRYESRGFVRALARNRAASLLWALHLPPGSILRLIGVPAEARQNSGPGPGSGSGGD